MGFIKWIKEVLDIEDQPEKEELHETIELPITEDEKELVAVIASCIVGKNKPGIQLHIQKITRIE